MTNPHRTDIALADQNLVMRILRTPIHILPQNLRRKSAERAIAQTNLPELLQRLILDVTNRSKLWRSERLDVARELASHFHDGLASGTSSDKLAENFGDRARAAALIHRSKKRCRPKAWHALALTTKAVGLLFIATIALYLALAARAFLTHPNIARNYLAEINADIEKIPEANRAWPLYRQAYLAQPRMPEEIAKEQFPAIKPEDPLWPTTVAYVKECQPQIKLLHQAAALPSLGSFLSYQITDVEVDTHSRWLAGTDLEKARAQSKRQADGFALSTDPNPDLIGVLIFNLGTMRHFARLLTLDARIAALNNDPARAHENLESMYKMSAHLSESGFIISGLVRLAIHDRATQTLSNILRDQPDLLSTDQLTSLAHVLARNNLAVDLSTERLFFYDFIQRAYSDNGRGDGHLTAEGFNLLNKYNFQTNGSTSLEALIAPAATGLMASRKEITRLYEQGLDQAVRFAATPVWKRTDADSPDLASANIAASATSRFRFLPVWALTPALGRAVWVHDESTQRSAGLLTAIAIEIYRRKHGSYPSSLADIETSILPAIPLDMFDGQPLRYLPHNLLDNNRPVIYSIGVDRKDDHARAPEKIINGVASPSNWMSESRLKDALQSPTERSSIDGDWILWPLSPDPASKSQ